MQAEPQDADGTIDGAVSGPERERPLVLVVNDTMEILELFREILEEEGFDVELASYGIDEVTKVEEIAPDLVILDFMIEGEAQGWQLLQKLRMARSTMDLPVIVCTGAIRLAQDLQGQLTAKNIGLVLKPFDIDDLIKEVNRVMRREAPSPHAAG